MAILCAIGVSAMARADEGLVAHYDFKEGTSAILKDKSGNQNDGQIYGAMYENHRDGHALAFNGQDAYVDCGTLAGIKNALTVEAWVCASSISEGEPGIVGEGTPFHEYWGLTCFNNGNVFFYVSSGEINCTSRLEPGRWHHVAGTFDGQELHLYVNGVLKQSRPLDKPLAIDRGGHTFIGRNGEHYFHGRIGEVRIYNRALPANEVQQHCQALLKSLPAASQWKAPVAVQKLTARHWTLNVGNGGGMEVRIGKESYGLDSLFSFPGEHIGFNQLSAHDPGGESQWKPDVQKSSVDGLVVRAEGKLYTLTRTAKMEGHRLSVADVLSNRTDAPLGIVVQKRIVVPKPYRAGWIGGIPTSRFRDDPSRGMSATGLYMSAENPTVFLSQENSSLGVVCEDDVARLQFETSFREDAAVIGVNHFALAAGESYTFRYSLYPFPKGADYYAFINRIRDDWKSNVTLLGQFTFLPVSDPLFNDPAALKRDLERRGLKIVALSPWLDYWNGAGISRPQFKKMMQKANRLLKQAAPDIRCLGCVENNIVSLERSQIEGGEIFDTVCKDSGRMNVVMSEQQTKLLQAHFPWKDSFLLNLNGRIMTEDCAPTTFVHAVVYAAPGNYQSKYLMDQFKFLIEEVGLDGVYIDQFNMAFEPVGYGGQRYDYSRWDGHSVDIDMATGKIARSFTDAALVGAPVTKELCEYVFAKGKVFVANTTPAVSAVQSLPSLRFIEPWTIPEPELMKEDKPPLATYMPLGHLGTPIFLGGGGDNVKKAMKGAICALRNGLLPYEYRMTIPEAGPGAGEYGALARMFPFTPLELHEGWLVGKERIITAVSVDTLWKSSVSRLNAQVFDLSGKKVDATGRFTAKRKNNGWHIVLKLQDWQEIAVVGPPESTADPDSSDAEANR